MNEFQLKVDKCLNHIQHGDVDLGYRLFIDCILDSKNLDFYKEAVALAEWQEKNENDTDGLSARLKDCLNRLRKLEIHASSKSKLFEVKNLQKTYRRSNFSMKPVNLEVTTGEVWGLVGENGNGKTSLLRILAQDLKYNAGEIKYFGELENLRDYDLRTKLTYIPQRTPKWYGSLMSNLKFTASHYGIKGEENELLVNLYVIRFGLWKFRKHQWNELSSGYKMRFELARTFLRSPRLLLLDEPLANLDVLAQQLILEDLKNLASSISNPVGIILSSQQLFEVEKVADKLIFLKDGKAVYVNQNDNHLAEQHSILELDVNCEKEQLQQALSSVGLTSLGYNGGVYIAEFKEQQVMNKALQSLIDKNIEIRYVRDISASTRRLFIKTENQ
jgi:ABC-2 type transport system ATP-binding protein